MRLILRVLALLWCAAAFAATPAIPPGPPGLTSTSPVTSNALSPYTGGSSRVLGDVANDSINAAYFCASALATGADAAPCLTQAITYAQTARASLGAPAPIDVYLPAGQYRLCSRIIVPTTGTGQVVLHGVYPAADGSQGTMLNVDLTCPFSPTYPPFLVSASQHLVVQDMGFRDAGEPAVGTGWAPTDYGAVFNIRNNSSATFNHIFLAGVNKFVDVFHSGSDHFQNIEGQVYGYVVFAEAIKDTSYFDTIHLNLYPQAAVGTFAAFNSADPTVTAWQVGHAIGILTQRNDGPKFSKMFTFGVKASIQFDINTTGSDLGPTTEATVDDVFCDHCQQTILVTGNGTTGFFHEVKGQFNSIDGTTTIAGSSMINQLASNTRLHVNNWRSNLSTGACISDAAGSGNTLVLGTGSCEIWGKDGSGVYGVNAPSVNTTLQTSPDLIKFTPGTSGTYSTATIPVISAFGVLRSLGQWDGNCPFILAIEGQSNARMTDAAGAKPTPANTYISNSGTLGHPSNPTGFQPAVFGSGVLDEGWVAGQEGTTTQTGITNPTLVFNNIAMQEAALIRAQGIIPAAEPIVILPNWFPGNDEGLWVANGTSSTNWAFMQAQLTLIQPAGVTASDGKVLTQVANCPVNHIIHSQGESNNDTATAYPAYDSYAGYLTGLGTWLAQWQATPQWSPQTMWTNQMLATWNDTYQNGQRNDALNTTRDGLFNRQMTLVTASGLIESAYPGPHWSGLSAPEIARRHLAAYYQGVLNGGYGIGAIGASGTATAVNDTYNFTAAGTYSIGSEGCRSGKMYINVTVSGVTINLPHPKLVSTGCEIEFFGSAAVGLVDQPNAAFSTAFGCAGNNIFDASTGKLAGAVGNPISIPAGQRIGKVGSLTVNPGTGNTQFAGCYWNFYGEQPIGGNVIEGGQALTAGASVTLTTQQAYNFSYYVNNNNVTLPAPANGLVLDFVSGSGAGDTTLTSPSGYTFALTDGTTAQTYSLSAGDKAHVIAQGLFWEVIGDTGNSGGFKLPIATKTAAYAMLGSDSMILCNATSAAFTVTLPSATAVGTRKKVYSLKKIDSSANVCTLSRSGTTDLIDGAATAAITTQYGAITVQSDGAGNWWKR